MSDGNLSARSWPAGVICCFHLPSPSSKAKRKNKHCRSMQRTIGVPQHMKRDFSFIGCGGANYFPFVWLAQNFRMHWYILCDGEEKTITRVNGQLKRVGLDSVDKLPNVSVIDGKTGYEGHLIATGYIDAIEKAFEETLGEGEFDRYIAEFDGKPGRRIDGKETTRDYKGAEGRERAARDLLAENKTRFAKSVATVIVALPDKDRRIPPAIRRLFDRIVEDLKEV